MTWCDRIRDLEASYNYAADKEWAVTEQLKTDLRPFRDSACGLTPDIFDRILSWKLRRQRARTERHRENIGLQMLSEVTRCAFQIGHEDRQCLAKTRLNLLSSLPGVGYGVASSIMALVFPDLYGVIDVRVWKVIYDEDRTSFTDAQFLRYMNSVWACSERLGWQPQKVDYFTWVAYESQQRAPGDGPRAARSARP